MNAENVTLHHRNKLHFKIYYKNTYLQYYCAYNQMNAAMVKKKNLFYKTILPTQNFWMVVCK